mmetsp:Transcript_5917/g.5772  ORF Transcript_5917/g.5772 Transcript_5917/m.5772 type:complete len:391 (-) Transcript_5917:110-1282(-)
MFGRGQTRGLAGLIRTQNDFRSIVFGADTTATATVTAITTCRVTSILFGIPFAIVSHVGQTHRRIQMDSTRRVDDAVVGVCLDIIASLVTIIATSTSTSGSTNQECRHVIPIPLRPQPVDDMGGNELQPRGTISVGVVVRGVGVTIANCIRGFEMAFRDRRAIVPTVAIAGRQWNAAPGISFGSDAFQDIGRRDFDGLVSVDDGVNVIGKDQRILFETRFVHIVNVVTILGTDTVLVSTAVVDEQIKGCLDNRSGLPLRDRPGRQQGSLLALYHGVGGGKLVGILDRRLGEESRGDPARIDRPGRSGGPPRHELVPRASRGQAVDIKGQCGLVGVGRRGRIDALHRFRRGIIFLATSRTRTADHAPGLIPHDALGLSRFRDHHRPVSVDG